MFYEVTVNGKLYYTNIKRKEQAVKIARAQATKGNNVAAFRRYPETDRQPGHTEIIWYSLFESEAEHG
jgi:hypothetical protein